MEISYKRAIADEELHEILELQRKNISISISEEEKQKEAELPINKRIPPCAGHDFQEQQD